MLVDIFMVYQFVKRLATPFNEWEAFKEGVIDEKGNIVLASKDRVKVSQRKSFGKFDLLVLKLKKLLEKVPGGSSRIASFAAALWLIKENEEAIESAETITEEELLEGWKDSLKLVEEHASVNDRFELFEETTQAASGVVDHSISMGKRLGKKKPAEIGTDEIVRRYRKGVPGQDIKEIHAPGGYKARAVGPNTRPADVRGVPLGSKRPMVKQKSQETQSDGTVKTVTKTVAGKFRGRSRSEIKVGSDDKTTKR